MSYQASVLFVATFALSIALPLRATTITSSTYTDWAASTTGVTHDTDFTHIQYSPYGPSGYTTSDGFSITGPDGSGFSLQGVQFNGYQSLQGGNDAAAQVLATTPAGGETALFFLFGSSPATPTGYTITLSDGETFTLAANATMFGLSVSHPVTSATLQTSSGSAVVLSDLSYATSNLPLDSGGTGDPSTVPEAATSLLLGSGLLIIAGLRKRILPF
jgi:hypothetical protein